MKENTQVDAKILKRLKGWVVFHKRALFGRHRSFDMLQNEDNLTEEFIDLKGGGISKEPATFVEKILEGHVKQNALHWLVRPNIEPGQELLCLTRLLNRNAHEIVA